MQADKTQTSYSISSLSKNSIYHEEVNDFLGVPVSKQIKNGLVALFDYFDNNTINVSIIVKIVTIFRFIQFILPSFLISDNKAYDHSSLSYKTLSILSIAGHFCPDQVRDTGSIVILYIYIVCSLCFIVCLISAGLYYKKKSYLSVFLANILSIYNLSIHFLLQAPAMQYSGELISKMISKDIQSDIHVIVPVVITLIIFAFNYLMLLPVFTLSLIFRPCSFITIEGSVQSNIVLTTCGTSFIIGLTCRLDKIYTIIAIVLSMLWTIVPIYQLFTRGASILILDQKLLFSGCIINWLNYIFGIIFIFLGPSNNLVSSELHIIIYCIIIIIGFVSGYFLVQSKLNKQLTILDDFDETKDINVIHSPKKLCSICATGYMYNHPSCLDFSMFTKASEEWPQSLGVWSVFAKFVSIYPEQTSTLTYIYNSIISNKFKGAVAETVLNGIKAILKTREANLTQDLKSALNECRKRETKSKVKLRTVWEQVLQRNMNDLEESIVSTIESIENSKNMFNRLLMIYPNNRFVAKNYARFAFEVLCDRKLTQEWVENSKKLTRGFAVREDKIRILALNVFPSLPASAVQLSTQTQVSMDDGISESMDMEDDGENDITNQMSESLENLIKIHKIPAIQFLKISTAAMLILLVLIPSIVLLCLFPTLSESFLTPLDLMYYTSYTRILLNINIAFTSYYMMSSVPDARNSDVGTMTNALVIPDTVKMTAFDGNKTPKEICSFLMTEMIDNIGNMNSLRDYKVGDTNLDQARHYMFDDILLYYFYTDKEQNTNSDDSSLKSDEYVAMDSLCSRISSQISKIIDKEAIQHTDITGAPYLTITNNYKDATRYMSNSCEFITSYIKELVQYDVNVYLYVMIALIIVICLTYLIVMSIQFKVLSNNKKEIFLALTHVPKTAIYNIIQNLSHIHKHQSSQSQSDSSRAELNKQEDNIVKILNSISDSSGSSSVAFIAISCYLLTAVCGCLSVYFICSTYQDMANQLTVNAPHINYLLGTISSMCSAYSTLFKLIFFNYDTRYESLILDGDTQYEQNWMDEMLTSMNLYFSKSRFGYTEEGDYPYIGIDEALASVEVALPCDDPLQKETTFNEIAACFDTESQVYLMMSFMIKFLGSVMDENIPLPKTDHVEDIFFLGPIILYETFYYPTTGSIISTINADINSNLTQLLIKSILFMVLSIVFNCIYYRTAVNEDNKLHFTFRLLLFCPPMSILQTNQIMSLLQGQYSQKVSDTIDYSTNYYNTVVDNVAEPILIYSTESGLIQYVNPSFTRCFNKSVLLVTNTNVHDVFKDDKNFESDPCEVIFDTSILTQTTNTMSQAEVTIVYNTEMGKKYYAPHLTHLQNKTSILSFRDVTQAVEYENAIKESKQQTSRLLSALLPEKIIKKYTESEKGIVSFIVKSITVAFIDFDDFNDWCEGQDTSAVNTFLQTFNRKIEELCYMYKTTNRIKCVQTRYMIVGGVFEETNQPQVHSKEVILYCLELIKFMNEMNEKLEKKLVMRIGVNTGGPIVCGVLALERPTFEMFGDTIDIANKLQMASLPNEVQVSRSVYELIYGGPFKIKERGEVTVEGQKMATYLVSSPDSSKK